LHNRKREEPSIFVVPTKVVEPMAEVITQPIKPTRVPLRHPYLIYSNFEHHAPNCLRKTKVQNMFRTKPTTIAIVVTKNLKSNNVPINVVDVVMTHSQILEQ
jgi:hypothetical protein